MGCLFYLRWILVVMLLVANSEPNICNIAVGESELAKVERRVEEAVPKNQEEMGKIPEAELDKIIDQAGNQQWKLQLLKRGRRIYTTYRGRHRELVFFQESYQRRVNAKLHLKDHLEGKVREETEAAVEGTLTAYWQLQHYREAASKLQWGSKEHRAARDRVRKAHRRLGRYLYEFEGYYKDVSYVLKQSRQALEQLRGGQQLSSEQLGEFVFRLKESGILVAEQTRNIPRDAEAQIEYLRRVVGTCERVITSMSELVAKNPQLQLMPGFKDALAKGEVIPPIETLWSEFSNAQQFPINHADHAFHKRVLGSERWDAAVETLQKAFNSTLPWSSNNAIGATVRTILRANAERSQQIEERGQELGYTAEMLNKLKIHQKIWLIGQRLSEKREIFKNHYRELNRALGDIDKLPEPGEYYNALFKLYEEHASSNKPYLERLLITAFLRRMGPRGEQNNFISIREKVLEHSAQQNYPQLHEMLKTAVEKANDRDLLPRTAQQFMTPQNAVAQVGGLALYYGMANVVPKIWRLVFGDDPDDDSQGEEGGTAEGGFQLVADDSPVASSDNEAAFTYEEGLAAVHELQAGLVATWTLSTQGDIQASEDASELGLFKEATEPGSRPLTMEELYKLVDPEILVISGLAPQGGS